MNVLDTVRRRAGIKKRALFVTLFVAVGIYAWYAEDNPWMFLPTVAAIILSIFFEQRVAIHVARENHKLMRSELMNIIHAETRMLKKYENALATCLEKMHLDAFERAIFENLWANSVQHRQDLIVLTLRKSVDALCTTTRDTDRACQSERLHPYLRKQAPTYKRILAALESRGGLLAKKRALQEREREFLKRSIAVSRGVLAQSRKLLVEYA